MSRKATIDIPESTGRDGAIDHAAKMVVQKSRSVVCFTEARMATSGFSFATPRVSAWSMFPMHHPGDASNELASWTS
jgi:hypothetical protein